MSCWQQSNCSKVERYTARHPHINTWTDLVGIEFYVLIHFACSNWLHKQNYGASFPVTRSVPLIDFVVVLMDLACSNRLAIKKRLLSFGWTMSFPVPRSVYLNDFVVVVLVDLACSNRLAVKQLLSFVWMTSFPVTHSMHFVK